MLAPDITCRPVECTAPRTGTGSGSPDAGTGHAGSCDRADPGARTTDSGGRGSGPGKWVRDTAFADPGSRPRGSRRGYAGDGGWMRILGPAGEPASGKERAMAEV